MTSPLELALANVVKDTIYDVMYVSTPTYLCPLICVFWGVWFILHCVIKEKRLKLSPHHSLLDYNNNYRFF